MNGISNATLVYQKQPAEKVSVRYTANLTGIIIVGIIFGLWVGLDTASKSENFVLAAGIAIALYTFAFVSFRGWLASTVG